MSLPAYNLVDFHNLYDNEVIISYKGLFDKHIRFVFGNYFYVRLAQHPEASKKMFRIFIELSQNVSYYSADTAESGDGERTGIGTLLVAEKEKFYTIITGNVVGHEAGKDLYEKCSTITTLDRNGLREFKREQRKLPRGVHGSANIGLIQVSLIADTTLQYNVVELDDKYSYFSVAIDIEK